MARTLLHLTPSVCTSDAMIFGNRFQALTASLLENHEHDQTEETLSTGSKGTSSSCSAEGRQHQAASQEE